MKAEKPVITEEMRIQIAAAVAEIDMRQIEIFRKMTPTERIQLGFSMIEAAESVGVYRMRQRDPSLSELEALHILRGGLIEHYKQGQKHGKIS